MEELESRRTSVFSLHPSVNSDAYIFSGVIYKWWKMETISKKSLKKITALSLGLEQTNILHTLKN
jgi:hypothetical protein